MHSHQMHRASLHCGVEQLVARRAHNPKVTGSSPVPATRSLKTSVFRLFFVRISERNSI